MKSLAIQDFLNLQTEGSTVIDVRSPAEFEKGHIPNAVNIPLFENHERAEVGTIYKQISKEKAIERGLEIVGPKMADFVRKARELSLPDKPILVYCWRGGMRSGSFKWLLNTAGITTHSLVGGYKAWRHHVLDILSKPLKIVVLGGETGSGKTEVLKALNEIGEQVIDLEHFARHKGSAFGALGESAQPTNEQFEAEVALRISTFDTEKVIWVEDESRMIGKVYIDQGFWNQMRNAQRVRLDIPRAVRVERLVKDYGKFDKDGLSNCILKIEKKLGGLVAKECLQALQNDDLKTVADLTLQYYDKSYRRCMEKTTNEKTVTLSFEEFNIKEILQNMKKITLSIFLSIFAFNAFFAQVVISEVNYNPDLSRDAGDWVEIWNSGTSAQNLNGWKVKDNDDLHIFNLPNTSLQANARLVIAANLASFNAIYPSFTGELGPLGFSLSGTADAVRIFNDQNTLIDAVFYGDTLPWNSGPDGTGRTLERNNPNASGNDPSNWFAGCILGSPGTAYIPCNEPIHFSEINYSSSLTSDAGDWLEIENTGVTAVNIGGWKLQDESILSYTFPSGTTIPANSRLVVAQDLTLFSVVHPTFTGALGNLPFSIGNNGEILWLYDNTGKVTFSMAFKDSQPWDTLPDGHGYTLELIDPSGNFNDASNWAACNINGSPGLVRGNCSVGTTSLEAQSIQESFLYPNPSHDEDVFVSLPKMGDFVIDVYRLDGRLLKKVAVSNLSKAKILSAAELPAAGIYFVKIQDSKGVVETVRFVKY